MVSRRILLGTPLWAALGTQVAAQAVQRGADTMARAPSTAGKLPITAGPFQPTADSLKTYQTPAWFRDAKFGIWAHWGPQAVPRSGDWYARWMYVPGHPHYAHHLKHYGHPSEFGYKDIIPLWKAEKFDPEALDGLTSRPARSTSSAWACITTISICGIRATIAGTRSPWVPKRDIVGAWRDAARRRGLRFGVSEHLGASHNWLYPSHSTTSSGRSSAWTMTAPIREYADLYHPKHDEPFKGNSDTWYTTNPAYHQIWFNRIRDLIDSYEPDLLYSDGGMPFGEVGRSLVAHYYNSSMASAAASTRSTTARRWAPASSIPKPACRMSSAAS